MKWLVRTMVARALVIAALPAIGLAMPSQFRVGHSIAINAPADRVYSLISGVDAPMSRTLDKDFEAGLATLKRLAEGDRWPT